MMPPQGSKTAQGYELTLGVNNIGTFLFTKLLTPVLISTAKVEPPNTIRVIWVASSATEIMSLKGTGIDLNNLDYRVDKSASYKYATSKTGNYFHAVEFAKRYRKDSIISCALNPGNLSSDLARTSGKLFAFQKGLIDYKPVFGAYTELFAGLSGEVTIERSGDWIVPFGRFLPIREDLVGATKAREEGGNGTGLRFWEWTEEQVKPYV
ncbi:hypothetical protein G7Y89_g5701 [Cudoniella acicularis]|uniref:Uncharacterized protein n=1 Tax=Cudoniella acicularis TaxID=354080 RepID=A0A8H4RQ84_9HELO|nr:hypothetical protein G7Y89_g5701 [Cudoniella acicularis]